MNSIYIYERLTFIFYEFFFISTLPISFIHYTSPNFCRDVTNDNACKRAWEIYDGVLNSVPRVTKHILPKHCIRTKVQGSAADVFVNKYNSNTNSIIPCSEDMQCMCKSSAASPQNGGQQQNGQNGNSGLPVCDEGVVLNQGCICGSKKCSVGICSYKPSQGTPGTCLPNLPCVDTTGKY